MSIEFSLTTDCHFNTQYAPLAALLTIYEQNQMLEPLKTVDFTSKTVIFSHLDKLKQLLVSILAGCETISEFNQKLDGERYLARMCGLERFADQSTLSIALDQLTLMNIEQLREAITQITRTYGRTVQHDWRRYLWLDFDLSGLPCGKQAEKSEKGYFAGKKTCVAAN